MRINKIIIKASIIVIFIQIICKIIGYSEKIVIAYYWGTDYRADAYYAVTTIIIGLALFFRELFEPVLLNIFSQKNTSYSCKTTDSTFPSLIYFFVITALLLSGIMIFKPTIFTNIFLPGFKRTHYDLTSQFFGYASIGLFFNIISTATNTYLLSKKHFISIAISEFLYKFLCVFFLIILVKKFGIYAAIIGFIIGCIIKFIWQWIDINQTKIFQWKRINFTLWKSIVFISCPLIIGNIFGFFNTIIQNAFASYLDEGTFSALNYAKKIIDLPVVIISYTISTIVFPFFSSLAHQNKDRELKILLNQSISFLVVFFIPLMVIITIFSEQIVQVIFQRGAFNDISTAITTHSLYAYNWGIVAFALETVLVVYYFGISNYKTPVVIGIVSVILNIILSYFLIDKLQYMGVAYAYTITRIIKVLLLLFYCRKKIIKKMINLITIIKVLIPFLILIPIYDIVHFYIDNSTASKSTILLILFGIVAFTYIVYFYWLVVQKIITYKTNRNLYSMFQQKEKNTH